MAKTLAALIGIVALSVLLGASVRAQSPAPSATVFDVASVKLNTSGEPGGSYGFRPGGQVIVVNNSLRNIVRNAYGLQNFQIIGGPEWFDRDRFDITARAADPNTTSDGVRTMMHALLASRFKLVTHRETRDVPIYAIVRATPDGRLGPKLQRSNGECAAMAEARRTGLPVAPGPTAPPFCGTRTSPGRIQAYGVSMSDLARNISNFAGRLVMDKSGLPDTFDVELEYTPDIPSAAAQQFPGLLAPPENGANLFTAVQEQLGLKLDAQRGPADVLVIDSAAKPEPD